MSAGPTKTVLLFTKDTSNFPDFLDKKMMEAEVELQVVRDLEDAITMALAPDNAVDVTLIDGTVGDDDARSLTQEIKFDKVKNPTAVVRIDTDADVQNTIAIFSPVRPSGRNYHPWFVGAAAEGLLLYPEEQDRSRLLELGCDGAVLTELVVDSLGPGEVIELMTDGRYRVTSPQPPFPSGLARVNDRVLWAARVVEGTDSVTVITAFDPDGDARQLRIRGWYQLFDSDADGALLFGNSWTNGQNWVYGASWGLFPAVLLVDGHRLLEFVDDELVQSR